MELMHPPAAQKAATPATAMSQAEATQGLAKLISAVANLEPAPATEYLKSTGIAHLESVIDGISKGELAGIPICDTKIIESFIGKLTTLPPDAGSGRLAHKLFLTLTPDTLASFCDIAMTPELNLDLGTRIRILRNIAEIRKTPRNVLEKIAQTEDNPAWACTGILREDQRDTIVSMRRAAKMTIKTVNTQNVANGILHSMSSLETPAGFVTIGTTGIDYFRGQRRRIEDRIIGHLLLGEDELAEMARFLARLYASARTDTGINIVLRFSEVLISTLSRGSNAVILNIAKNAQFEMPFEFRTELLYHLASNPELSRGTLTALSKVTRDTDWVAGIYNKYGQEALEVEEETPFYEKVATLAAEALKHARPPAAPE